MRFLALGGFVGPVLFALVVVVAATFRPDYSHITNFISELGATDTVHASFMNYAGFVPGGVLLAGFGISLSSLLPRGRAFLVASVLTTVFGAGVALSGLVSCDVGCPATGGSIENSIHDKIAPISFLCLIVATGIVGVSIRRLPAWRPLSLYSILTSVVAFALFIALVGSLETRVLTGLWQRLMLCVLFVWTGVIGYKVFRGRQEATR